MEIKDARFHKSSQNIEQCPNTQFGEVAFIGRSNVGKSSLINSLLQRKNLAKTSSTPGKTQLINHFLVNDQWFLVDLPGYGYAKVSKSKIKKWNEDVTGYFTQRNQLLNTFVLIDSRIPPQKIDIDFINWLGEGGLPFAIIFTKTDKLSASNIKKNTQVFKNTLLEHWEELPPTFTSSSITHEGRDEILEYIEFCIEQR